MVQKKRKAMKIATWIVTIAEHNSKVNVASTSFHNFPQDYVIGFVIAGLKIKLFEEIRSNSLHTMGEAWRKTMAIERNLSLKQPKASEISSVLRNPYLQGQSQEQYKAGFPKPSPDPSAPPSSSSSVSVLHNYNTSPSNVPLNEWGCLVHTNQVIKFDLKLIESL